jgi:predicted dehydrogenase
MKRPINIGVIGCGYWGPNHVRNLKALPDCAVTCICDKDKRRLSHLHAIYPDLTLYTDLEQMLVQGHLDAVVIATGLSSHHPIAKACLGAGLHTLIEKPMAATSDQCLELIALAESKDLVIMVGHTFLYSAHVRKIKEILDAGDLGELQYISSRRLNLGLFQRDINVTWDLAPHDLSIILCIMGELPVSVNCIGKAHIRDGIEDVTSLCLLFPHQRFANVQSSWLDPRKVREMTIVGSRRMIVYDDVEPLEKIKIYDSRVEVPPHYDTFAEFHYAYHYGDSYIPYVKQEEPLRVECQHFLDCIARGDLPISGGHQGMQLVRILEAASASLKQDGVPISLAVNGSSHGNGNGHGAANGNGAVLVERAGVLSQPTPLP